MPGKLLLADGYNLVRRIYEARPEKGREEALAELVEQATRSLQRALDHHRPTHAACVFEYHDPTWRHLLYPEYKAGRKPTPPPLLAALGQFIEAFQLAGVPSLAVESYEADDVIATLANRVAGGGHEVVILASDKMYLQLLGDRISVYDHFAGRFLDRAHVAERFGVAPGQLIDYWAMAGDATNNIKGVSGIGAKSAATLLERFGTLAAILEAGSEDKLAARVRAQEHAATVARRLVTLKLDVEIGINFRELRYYHGK